MRKKIMGMIIEPKNIFMHNIFMKVGNVANIVVGFNHIIHSIFRILPNPTEKQ